MGKEQIEILGIIGARSGSKGVLGKNIKYFSGKPLMSWIIGAARNSKYIKRVIVSTDSEEYALVAKSFGADVPFLRPKDLALDTSPEVEYVIHAVNRLEKEESYVPDIVVRLMPTVPGQKSKDIDGCIEALLNDSKADSSVVIAEARQHPMKSLKLVDDENDGEYLTTYITENPRDVTPIARQSYPKAYVRANVIACRTDVIKNKKSLTGDKIRPYVVNGDENTDIDTELDFLIAELLFEHYNG